MTAGARTVRQRELARELAAARDAQVAKVVALVDAMRERGAADELIAPLRTRLHHMHVDRPIRLGRLLFLPLDPVIVDTRGWRAGEPCVPRGALGPLLALVRQRLGAAVDAIERAIAGRNTVEAGVISRAGGMLWPLAADVLREAAGGTVPAGWGDDGVPAGAFGAIARGVGGVLAQAVRLHALGAATPKDESIAAVLSGAGACGTETWALMVAVLLARLPGKRQVLRLVRAAGGDSGSLRSAGERAVDAMVDHAAASLQHFAELDLAEAGAEAGALAVLIEEFGEAAGPKRLAALAALGAEADRSCRSRFQASIEGEFLGAFRGASAGAPEVVKGLEATARDLRRFEREARRIGGAESYDALLRRTAAGVGAGGAALTAVERARLVEILAGPEEALRLLRAEGVSVAGG